jgi:hypothetical protein
MNPRSGFGRHWFFETWSSQSGHRGWDGWTKLALGKSTVTSPHECVLAVLQKQSHASSFDNNHNHKGLVNGQSFEKRHHIFQPKKQLPSLPLHRVSAPPIANLTRRTLSVLRFPIFDHHHTTFHNATTRPRQRPPTHHVWWWRWRSRLRRWRFRTGLRRVLQ